MELLNFLAQGFEIALTIKGISCITLGVALGVFAGAMPGLSPSAAVALLVPLSFTMDPTLALILLTSVYIASNFGGSITAILINTPGTPASTVTAIDGYILTQRGESKKALFHALFASTLGGAIGILILILFAIPLAKVALRFAPQDYFALALFGLSTVMSMGKGNVLKSLIAILLGLLIKTIGIDPISGVNRFSFGSSSLFDGIGLIPALIGLFALSVFFEKVANGFKEEILNQEVLEKGSLETFKGLFSTLRGSIIGTIVGIFPGAGATVASFLTYDIEKKITRDEAMGSGSVRGIAASESANSSSVGGALIPLLSLGIPGSATDAVLIGAFMLHDLNPGPLLFEERPDLVYAIFASLILANIFLLIFGTFSNKLFSKIIDIKEKYIFPIIFLFSIAGSYSVNNKVFDVFLCLLFGVIGFVLKKYKFPVAPIVLGMVLSKILEENLRRVLLKGSFEFLFEGIIAKVFISLALISFIYPLFKRKEA